MIALPTIHAVTMAPVYDVDARVFFSAAGITDRDQKVAIHRLVRALKASDLWNESLAIYPFVGGTDASHAVNLRSPGTYDLVFVGSPSHSDNGVTPDGSTACAVTGVIPNDVMSSSAGAMSYYSRTNSRSGYDMGASEDAFAMDRVTGVISRYSDDNFYALYGTSTSALFANNTDSRGLFTVARNDVSTTAYKNGVEQASENDFTALPKIEIYLFANNGAGSVDFFSDRQCAYASISAKQMSGADAVNEYVAVQEFQTALNREV